MKRIILLAVTILALNVNAQSKFRTTSVDTSAISVNLGNTTVTNVNVAYNGSTTIWVKMYDSFTKPYAKNAVPVHTLQIPGNTVSNPYSLLDLKGLRFTKGLWIRCTTSISDTSQKSGEPTTKPIVEIAY